MSKNQEKFKTMIGGQALIEGIMMRGPKTDAIVVRTKEGLKVEKTPRKIHSRRSVLSWPLVRGVIGFFDAQVTGVKALMKSADLSQDEQVENPSKFDLWLEKKLGEKKFRDVVVGTAVAISLCFMILLFFLIPNTIGTLFKEPYCYIVEGVSRILIFLIYMLLLSRMAEIKRVFAYHGAEHKTIRCYEAGLPLTVENVRKQSRKHPRCGTSFLFVVMILSILVFSTASAILLAFVPSLKAMQGTLLYGLIMFGFKLLLLPLVVAVSYEVNRLVGRHDNWFTKILTAPGMWFQVFTTNEPDDDMIEVGIAALEAVLPETEGEDRW
jgi:uncharacterized protein YqhQ